MISTSHPTVSARTAIVTGGTSGIGAGVSRALAADGWQVFAATASRAEIASFTPTAGVMPMHIDVTDQASVDGALAAIEGDLAGLVNCAGIGTPGKTVGKDGPMKLADFTRVINVNLIGTFNMIRLAAAAIVKNAPTGDGERGVIVNTASVAAFDGQIGQAAYSASKGGIVGMTLPVARDLARDGIRVCSIAPGIVDTALQAGLPAPAGDAPGQQAPFPSRLGKPEEYALLAQHIVENSMLNAETIRLDGGVRLAAK